MELDELHVLEGEAGAERHRIAVAGAGVRLRRREIDAPAAARGEHDHVRAETVDAAVLEAPRHDAAAGAVLVHDEIERVILDEELGVVLEALLVERVQHGVAGAVGRGGGALRDALAVMRRHAAERALIDLAVLEARERHAPMLELDDRRNALAAHVFDRVLVAEPVGALDRVVHVPAPVVLAHVAERGADAALRRHRVAARREHLGDARGLEARLRHAQGRAQATAAGADDDDVVDVIGDRIGLGHLSLRKRCSARRTRRRRRTRRQRTS